MLRRAAVFPLVSLMPFAGRLSCRTDPSLLLPATPSPDPLPLYGLEAGLLGVGDTAPLPRPDPNVGVPGRLLPNIEDLGLNVACAWCCSGSLKFIGLGGLALLFPFASCDC